MLRTAIVAIAAILLIVVSPPAARAQTEPYLATAAANICAYAGEGSRDCRLANSGRILGFEPTIFQTQGGWTDMPFGFMHLNNHITEHATQTAVLFHEIQHAKDWQDGLIILGSPASCAATERHAYTAQMAIWTWMADTFGKTPGNDNFSAAMNQYLGRDNYYVDFNVRLAQFAQCSQWH
jgi:hypothetical protein